MAPDTWRALRRGLWGAVAVMAVGVAIRAVVAFRTPPPPLLSPTEAATALEASVPPSWGPGPSGSLPGRSRVVSVALPTGRGWTPVRFWRGRVVVVALAPTRPAAEIAAALYHEWVRRLPPEARRAVAWVTAAPRRRTSGRPWAAVWRAFRVSALAVVPTLVVMDPAGRVRFVDVVPAPGTAVVREIARQAALLRPDNANRRGVRQ
jgi:hypothetical protein